GQFARLARVEEPVGEPGGEECGPEAVARPAEVVADRRGVEARVDAAEEYVEAGRDEVRDGLLLRGNEIGPRGSRAERRAAVVRASRHHFRPSLVTGALLIGCA